MKTSNKILLIFFLSILGVIGAIQLVLYARLKEGKIIRGLQQDEGWVLMYQGKAPAILAVEGNVNVDLIPSDKFFIEIADDAGSQIGFRKMEGDSMLVSAGAGLWVNPHGIFQDYGDRRWVRIHANAHTLIRLRHLLALLGGSTAPGGTDRPDWDLEATDAQVLMGDAFGIRLDFSDTAHYHSVHIDARNSNLVLYRNADAEALSVKLDERSELNDMHARIGRPAISYADGSKINLTGVNLGRLLGKE